jgi:hypothetical protein
MFTWKLEKRYVVCYDFVKATSSSKMNNQTLPLMSRLVTIPLMPHLILAFIDEMQNHSRQNSNFQYVVKVVDGSNLLSITF